MTADFKHFDLIQRLEAHIQETQSIVSFLKGMEVKIPTFESILESKKYIFALTINGKSRKATEAEIEKLNPHDFAIYLNTATEELSISSPVRKPTTQSAKEADIDGVQDILGVMLQYPHLNIGNINIAHFLPHRSNMTPDAFRKAVAKIRYALKRRAPDRSLLLRSDRSHYCVTETGYAWRISMEYGDLCCVNFLPVPGRFRRINRP